MNGITVYLVDTNQKVGRRHMESDDEENRKR